MIGGGQWTAVNVTNYVLLRLFWSTIVLAVSVGCHRKYLLLYSIAGLSLYALHVDYCRGFSVTSPFRIYSP